ncbi:MAG: hypothetical protein LBS83_01865 [Holosporales bacterium]|nr:hypothetical protein [Holosporales bacterium]
MLQYQESSYISIIDFFETNFFCKFEVAYEPQNRSVLDIHEGNLGESVISLNAPLYI